MGEFGCDSYYNLDTEESLEVQEEKWDDSCYTSIHEDVQEEVEEKLVHSDNTQEETTEVAKEEEPLADYVYKYNQSTSKEALEGKSIDYENIQATEK